MANLKHQFPSLTGVIRFLIAVPIYAVPSSVRKFPSLTGVIRFLIVNADKNYIGISEFPSLTGVIHFLI